MFQKNQYVLNAIDSLKDTKIGIWMTNDFPHMLELLRTVSSTQSSSDGCNFEKMWKLQWGQNLQYILSCSSPSYSQKLIFQ